MPPFEDSLALQTQQTWRDIAAHAQLMAAYDPAGTMQTAAGVGAWANIAPTLPAGVLTSLGSSGVDPNSDMGQWLIRDAVVRLTQPNRYPDPQKQQYAMQVLSDPALLEKVKQLPIDVQTHLFNTMGAEHLAALSQSDLNDVLNGKVELTAAHRSSGGGGILGSIGHLASDVVGDVGSVVAQAPAAVGGFTAQLAAGENPFAPGGGAGSQLAAGPTPQVNPKAVVRVAGAAAMAPLQTVGAGLRMGNPGSTLRLPLTGAVIHHGSLDEQTNIGSQTTLGQMLQGKNAGSGFLPAGEAAAAQGQASVQAGAVYKNMQDAQTLQSAHALTAGRGVAAFVTSPGTIPYNLISGPIDATVAIKGDPTALFLSETSNARNAARLFADTPEEAQTLAAHSLVDQAADDPKMMSALRAWTGTEPMSVPLQQAIVDKLQAGGSPASLLGQGFSAQTTLSAIGRTKAGAFSGLRNYAHPQSYLEYQLTPAGQDFAKTAANTSSFTRMRQLVGKDVPVEIVSQLTKEDTPEGINRIMADGVAEGGVAKLPAAGYAWHPDPTKRWSQFMPHGTINFDYKNNAVEQDLRTMATVGVDRATQDEIAMKVADAPTRGAFNAIHLREIPRALSQRLQDAYGLSRDTANKIVKVYSDRTFEDAKFYQDENGNLPIVPGITMDEQPFAIHGPVYGAELAQDMPVIDGRSLLAAASKTKQLIGVYADDPATFQKAAKFFYNTADYAANGFTVAWKAGHLFRLGLPVRIMADAMARMATSGQFDGIGDYVGYALNRRGGVENLTSDALRQDAGKLSSDYARSIGQQWIPLSQRPGTFDPNTVLMKGWTSYGKNDPEYIDSWADGLRTEASWAPSSHAARMLLDPQAYTHGDLAGVDALKENFYNGGLAPWRRDLVDAHVKWSNQGIDSSRLADRQGSDWYVDNILIPHVMQTTRNNPSLLDAVATGEPFGPRGINRDITRELEQMRAIGPDFVKGRARALDTAGKPRALTRIYDRLMGATIDLPYRTMAKSPTWRKAFWDHGEYLLPKMTPEAQNEWLASAKEANLEFATPTRSGTLELADAEKLASSWAAARSMETLHYVAERSDAMQAARYILPFGDAWRNVITQWSRLAVQHPQVIRRVQQGLTELQDSGFFYKDSLSGQEVFTMVPGRAMAALGMPEWPLSSPVKGLSIAEGLPGIGPVVSIPADKLAATIGKDNPTVAAIQSFFEPYGPATQQTSDIWQTVLPGWLDRLQATGWLAPIINPSSQQKITLMDLTKRVVDYKISNGENPNDNPNFWADATRQAKMLYLVRGAAQFVAPSAPDYIPKAFSKGANEPTKGGQLLEQARMAQDWRDILKRDGNDEFRALTDFVNLHGIENIALTEPLNRRLTYGVPTDGEGLAFQAQHRDLFHKYPQAIGYWVPQGGPFDYPAYLRAIDDGSIQALTPEEWWKVANARVGQSIYSNIRQRLPASLSVTDSNYLAQVKDALGREYPGFGDETLKKAKLAYPDQVKQLTDAANDPKLRNSDLARGIQTYTEARDQALGSIAQQSGHSLLELHGQQSPFGTGRSHQALREWLFRVGTQIAQQDPAFQAVWDYVFRYEVNNPNADITSPQVVVPQPIAATP